jgi:predicted dehydrogenase
VERVMRDFHNCSDARVVAVASRSLERARDAACKYGAQYAFGSYAELAACDEVDLVYIATPHNYHCEQAILMMRAGKHVLCEKPLAINGDQARAMVNCARERNVFLMEAMWTRFFPASEKLRELAADGAIGNITHIYAEFAAVSAFDPKSRLYDLSLAGGALLDLGIYPVMAATMLLGYDPVITQGVCSLSPAGADARSAIQLSFKSGATAQLMCALDAHGESREIIYGDRGRITVPDFWHPTAFTLETLDGECREFTFAPETEGHHHQFGHACDLIRNGVHDSPVMSWDETIAIADMFTALRREWGVEYPDENRGL